MRPHMAVTRGTARRRILLFIVTGVVVLFLLEAGLRKGTNGENEEPISKGRPLLEEEIESVISRRSLKLLSTPAADSDSQAESGVVGRGLAGGSDDVAEGVDPEEVAGTNDEAAETVGDESASSSESLAGRATGEGQDKVADTSGDEKEGEESAAGGETGSAAITSGESEVKEEGQEQGEKEGVETSQESDKAGEGEEESHTGSEKAGEGEAREESSSSEKTEVTGEESGEATKETETEAKEGAETADKEQTAGEETSAQGGESEASGNEEATEGKGSDEVAGSEKAESEEGAQVSADDGEAKQEEGAASTEVAAGEGTNEPEVVDLMNKPPAKPIAHYMREAKVDNATLRRWKKFTLGPKMKGWDLEREQYKAAHPGCNVSRLGKPRMMLVTASNAAPCDKPAGNYLLNKMLKNKIDYTRIKDIELYEAQGLLRQDFEVYWCKYPLLRSLMLGHPEVEWFWWMDSDAIITDMAFDIPLERYNRLNLVIHGWKEMVYDLKDWTGVNAGIFLIRNCRSSLDLLDEWASYGVRGETRNFWGKVFYANLRSRPIFDGDDQAAIQWILQHRRKKWGHRVLIEHSYALHSFWKPVVQRYSEIQANSKPGKGDDSWPFVTHFVGCKFCEGSESYEAKECQDQILRAFNLADNQVLARYGYHHPTLESFDIVVDDPSTSASVSSSATFALEAPRTRARDGSTPRSKGERSRSRAGSEGYSTRRKASSEV
eukprot:TRINITY_DN14533_c0_g1_i1.p1 TRINITY_DN14533_c0_g1~~TRINITY_DN14533_c0_g1_i1.p1  ORF type:complete len:722 (-),score=165.74 TRINITY_DN14533_c0_g1_i1:417-2582(-)